MDELVVVEDKVKGNRTSCTILEEGEDNLVGGRVELG